MSIPTSHRGWSAFSPQDGLYFDSVVDTGVTMIPAYARMHGTTGTYGLPLFETLISDDQPFALCMAVSTLPDRWFHRATEHEVVVFAAPSRRSSPAEQGAAVVDLPSVVVQLRAHAGLPVNDLAAAVGVSRRQVYNWIGGAQAPDAAQERRIRRTAGLIERLHERFGDPSLVRAALFTSSSVGSPFDALAQDDPGRASRAASEVMTGSPPALAELDAASRERIELELEHLRDDTSGEDA